MGFIEKGTQINRAKRFLGLKEVLNGVSKKMKLDFEASEAINHDGDKGEEREIFLKNFMTSGHFPKKYSISKGHGAVISRFGHSSLQTDLVIYDALNCPVLKDGESHQYFPIESVYAVIEVKSKLSKAKLIESAKNIGSVKRLTSYKQITREISCYSGSTVRIGDVQPIPFGAVFAYSLDENSLKSLEENLIEYNSTVSPLEWINLVCILNEGVIYTMFDIFRVLDSRDIVKLHSQGQKYWPNGLHCGEDALLNFYLGIMGNLSKLDLMAPPLDEYVELPIASRSGHSYRVKGAGMEIFGRCDIHGPHELQLSEEWISKISSFLDSSPKVYKPSEYLAAQTGASSPAKMMGGNIDDLMPDAHVFSQDGTNPLVHLKFEMKDGRPEQRFLEIEFDGTLVFLPQIYVTPNLPLFLACPKCPAGETPKFYGGLED